MQNITGLTCENAAWHPDPMPKPRAPRPLPPSLQPAPKRLATLGEAADYLKIDERTVRRFIAEGRLAGYRIGGKKLIRVDLNEIDESLLERIPTADEWTPGGPRPIGYH